MKRHRPIQVACESALYSIFAEGRHAEKVVAYYLKSQRKWGARDRRQFAELVYDVVRWWRLLLRMARAPDSLSSADVTPQLIAQVLIEYEKWRDAPSTVAPEITRWPVAVKESIPDWLDERGRSEFSAQPSEWPVLLHALNQPAQQYLRVNELKTNLTRLKQQLLSEDVATEVVPEVGSALTLSERKNVFQTQCYKSGLFEMQDAGSQLIAPLLKVEPGQRVVDACAGAGGKALHLASLMANKGRIMALDIHPWKLEELKSRARRAGVSIIETKVIENTKVVKRLYDSADRLLLDVPCSGLGVMRRHPDTKWKLSVEELDRLAELQMDILRRYSPMVKIGGYMVYATCSVLPSENELRISEFLNDCTGQESVGFELEEEIHVWPHKTEFDGFYAARLRRVK